MGERHVERESVQISLDSSPPERSDLYHPRRLASGTTAGDAPGRSPNKRALPEGKPGPAEESERALLVGDSRVQLTLHQSFSGGTVIIGDGAQVQLNVHQNYAGTGTTETDGGGSLAVEGVDGGHSLSLGDQVQIQLNEFQANLVSAKTERPDSPGLPSGAAGEGSSGERFDHRAIRVYRAQMDALLEASDTSGGEAPEVRWVGQERVSISRRSR